jgi:small subunit ribosomal protein S2
MGSNMAPYIYMERNGIHIINLYKTAAKIEEANEALKKNRCIEKYYSLLQKTSKDIVAEKKQKAANTSLKMAWWNAN